MSGAGLQDFLDEQARVEAIIAACASQRGIRLMPSAALWNGGSLDVPDEDEKRVVEMFARSGHVASFAYWKWELDETPSNHLEQRILRALAGL